MPSLWLSVGAEVSAKEKGEKNYRPALDLIECPLTLLKALLLPDRAGVVCVVKLLVNRYIFTDIRIRRKLKGEGKSHLLMSTRFLKYGKIKNILILYFFFFIIKYLLNF